MNEIYFYDEFAYRFSQYLKSYLVEEYEIHYSQNKTLDKMISEIESKIGFPIIDSKTYIPKLKLDILMAIVSPTKKVKLILVEAKYLSQLSLQHYSQLVGYLQVAKNIDLGLLLLIKKGNSPNKLSNDFQEIIRLKKLPMDWIMDMKKLNEQYKFKTGIINYIPSGNIDWIDTREIEGISSFEELVKLLK